jgi:hypothetical protein
MITAQLEAAAQRVDALEASYRIYAQDDRCSRAAERVAAQLDQAHLEYERLIAALMAKRERIHG